MKKPFLASLATVALAFSGVVSGVAPANAVVYNTDSALQYQTVLRLGSPTITGTNVVANLTLATNESFNNGYSSLTQYASVAAPLNINVGEAVVFNGTAVNTSTQASIVNTSSTSTTYVFWTKVGDSMQSIWNSQNQTLSDLPTGAFKDYQVFRTLPLSFSASAGSYQTSTGLSVAGAAVTPLAILATTDFTQNQSAYIYDGLGFSVRWKGGVAYTPTAVDTKYSMSSTACIWPAELGLTTSSVLKVSYNNLDTVNNSFASSNTVSVSGYTSGGGSTFNGQSTQANEVFTIPLTNVSFQAMSVYASASLVSPTPNEVRPVYKAWLSTDVTETNILEPCQKFESVAAPTLTPVDASSATLSWSAPTSANASSWTNVRVYACSIAVTSVCGDMSLNYGGISNTRPYDFFLSGPVNGTSVTLTSASMRAALMGPPSGAVPSWSATASYRYFVFFESPSYYGYKGVSALTAASVAGLGAPAPSTPSTPSVSAPSAPSEPVLKGFTGHNVAKTTQKTFALDASGLTGTPEVLLNGQKLTYVKDAKGMLAIELPKTLKRGGSYDLVVSSPEGLVTVMGAIVVSADLPITKNTPSAFKGTSTALSASQVRNIRALVTASEVGDTVTCTAYVSGATTDEIAKARATSACAAATAVNPELKTVIRTAPAIFSVRNKVRVVIG